jgi:hypothetical protein
MAYIGKQPVVGNFVKLDAIVTSATATYNLLNGGVAYFPQTANNCIVSLNGVIQSPTSAYTISGSTIVFDSALTSADSIDFILVLGDVLAIGTPSDATVSFAKVTSNLITGATAETSIAGGDSVLIYDDSASALRKMTRTNFVSGVGGTNTPAFFADLSSSQNISASTFTKVQFDNEILDSDSNYDNATNYRFTPTTSGKYYFFTRIEGQSTNTNDVEELLIQVKKNGSNIIYSAFSAYPDRIFHAIGNSIAGVVSMNGTSDYLEVFGNVDVSSGTPAFYSVSTLFGAYKLIGV